MTISFATDTQQPARDLTGQVVLITGGGRGIGRAIARELGTAGATVAVTARSMDQLIETKARIEDAGGHALAIAADVTDHSAVTRAVETIEAKLGPIDLLVNNAGIGGPIGPLWEVDSELWWQTIDVNLRGVFLCTRVVLPGMVERGKGRIVNIASHAGVHRWPQVSAYAVSKAAVIKLTENLASETKRKGIAVFAIHPGAVLVGPTAEILETVADPETPTGRVAAWFRQEIANGRGVPPERAGVLVRDLASGRADALTGRYLTVYDDLDVLIHQSAEIQKNDLYTLKLRQTLCDDIWW